MPQTLAYQAKVSTHANLITGRRASISYAQKGIATEAINGDDTDGGAIIECNETDFYNNKRDIVITGYKQNQQHDNISYVDNCVFKTDAKTNHFIDGIHKEHISIKETIFISIDNSTFSAENKNSHSSKGIVTFKAGVDVDNCNFSGYRSAILFDERVEINLVTKFAISNCHFSNNSIGIEAQSVTDETEIIGNTFMIGGYPSKISSVPTTANHGIYQKNSYLPVTHGNHFEDEDFIPIPGKPSDFDSNTPTFGVVMDNAFQLPASKQREDFHISESTFLDLDSGVEALGVNNGAIPSSNKKFGLKVHCNDFTNRFKSLYVLGDPFGGGGGGIATDQYEPGVAAGNTFTSTITGRDNVLENSFAAPIVYYHLTTATIQQWLVATFSK